MTRCIFVLNSLFSYPDKIHWRTTTHCSNFCHSRRGLCVVYVWLGYTLLVYGHYKLLIISARGWTSSESDVYRRQILTSKVGPRTERVDRCCAIDSNPISKGKWQYFVPIFKMRTGRGTFFYTFTMSLWTEKANLTTSILIKNNIITGTLSWYYLSDSSSSPTNNILWWILLDRDNETEYIVIMFKLLPSKQFASWK